MKNHFILVFLLMFFTHVKAQQITYQPFYASTSMWLYHEQVSDGQGALIESYTRTIWSGDTLINNQHYVPIYRSGGLDPITAMWYIGAFREDTLSQQQFLIDTNELEHNITISPFLQVGDTVPLTSDIAYGLYFNSDANQLFSYIGEYMVVEELDSSLVNGSEYRSEYLLFIVDTFSGETQGQLSYRSGIGVEFFSKFEYDVGMQCYKEDDSLILGGGSWTPWQYSCIAEVAPFDQFDFKISPNPARDRLSITGPVTNYSIYTTSGQKLDHGVIFNNEIVVSQLSEGFYLIQLSDEKGNSSTRRIVIE